MVGFVSQLALPVKSGARSVKPARHLTVAGKALKLKRPRRVVVCAPRALKGARGESRTEAPPDTKRLPSFVSTSKINIGRRLMIPGG